MSFACERQAKKAAEQKLRIGLVCVSCGAPVPKLVHTFSAGNVRLHKCGACGLVADKYVEYESALVVIDLVLLKHEAFRHTMYNVAFTRALLVRAVLVSVALDAIMKWVLLYARIGGEAAAAVAVARAQQGGYLPLSPLRLPFPAPAVAGHLLLAAALDALVFLATLLVSIRLNLFVMGGSRLLTRVNCERVVVGTLSGVTVKAAVLLLVLVFDFQFSFVHSEVRIRIPKVRDSAFHVPVL